MESKVTGSVRKALEYWLTGGARDDRCPFHALVIMMICPICRDIFPRCKAEAQKNSLRHSTAIISSICPCHLYTHAYVVRKARQIVKGDTL